MNIYVGGLRTGTGKGTSEFRESFTTLSQEMVQTSYDFEYAIARLPYKYLHTGTLTRMCPLIAACTMLGGWLIILIGEGNLNKHTLLL